MYKSFGFLTHRATLLMTVLAFFVQGVMVIGGEDEKTRLTHYNIGKNQLALQGYDPVSYFQEGPVKGKSSISAEHNGILYYFANEQNRQTFQSAPEKYEPAYGGWCATALLDGTKYKIDPKSYKIVDGRNLLFYKGLLGNALKAWNERAAKEGESGLVDIANGHWQKIIDP